MLDRPARVAIGSFEGQCACAVGRRSSKPLVACPMPGVCAEIYVTVSRHLNISRETHAVSERSFSSGSSLRPGSPCGACDEETDALDGLLGAYECGIGSWIAEPERMRQPGSIELEVKRR